MFAVMKTFVTDISASTGRNDFIFDIWLLHGDLYRVSPFQVYRTSTSCLQCDLEFFMFAVIKTLMFKNILYFSARLVQVFNFHIVITKFYSLWLHKSLLCTFQPVYNDLY
jgi:hypothetical protein